MGDEVDPQVVTWRRNFLQAGGFSAVCNLLQQLATDESPQAEHVVKLALGPVAEV